MELSRARDLAQGVRRSQRATWFPLLVFGILTIAALPVTFAGHIVRAKCVTVPGGLPGQEVCRGYNSAAFIYWPIALVLAYVLIAAFFIRRSDARGVGTRIIPYVLAGIVISIALTATSVWADHRPVSVREREVLGWHLHPDDLYRFIAPACAIGLALLVLAAVERSPALFAATVAYLIIAIAPVDFGWTISSHSRWAIAPHDVIPGSVLLLTSLCFALTQRSPRPA
ncbi:MAG: hypothetical protein ABI775_03305 [Pseudonocardiales bacterium]|nr:hypothetical protein [Actinomycetota bacterium]